MVMAALGAYTLWDVWNMPSESRNAFLFGLSRNKLAMCAGIALLALVCLAGGILSFLDRSDLFSSGKAAGWGAFILTFGLILGRIFLLPPVGRTAFERSLLERLTPAAYWAFAFVIAALLIMLIGKRKQIRSCLASSVPALIWGGIFLLASSGAVYFALYSGIGLDPISGTFYRQGVSLLEGHLILPLLFLYPLFPLLNCLSVKFSGRPAGRAVPILTAVLVWAAAVYFWQTTGFEGRSYFAPALRPPNYNFYPASDAENYDLLAQGILLGNGFRSGLTVVRPLYVAFLALLHRFFGNDYMRVTNGQILLLAVIPVLVFLTGRHLRHAKAGLLAAVWVIWREIYAIRVTPYVQVSNSRLLMSDLPAMLLVLAVLLSAVKWQHSENTAVRSLLCGGLAGAAMLLRTQCFVLVPALWLLFLCSGKKGTVKLRSVILSLLGMLIVFMPWTVWGKIHPNTTVNADTSEGQYLLHLYQNATGETDPNAGLPEMILKHPAETFHAVGSHFLNNEISSLLVLPVRLTAPAEADQLFYEKDLFWYRENARETIEQNTGLILFYLAIISFGIISAYRKAGFSGLAPLMIHLAYNLGNAFALNSGFRFILPVDWALLFYFAVGCSAVLEFFTNVLLHEDFSLTDGQEPAHGRKVPQWAAAAAVCLGLILTGAVLPCCDSLIPQHFPAETAQETAEKWKSGSGSAAAILAAYPEEDLTFLEGRAFYPRFYKADEGDSGGSSSAKQGLDMDRLVWMFQNEQVHVLSCPLAPEQVPAAIADTVPDPMDVIVVGFQREDYIEVIEMIRLDAVKER